MNNDIRKAQLVDTIRKNDMSKIKQAIYSTNESFSKKYSNQLIVESIKQDPKQAEKLNALAVNELLVSLSSVTEKHIFESKQDFATFILKYAANVNVGKLNENILKTINECCEAIESNYSTFKVLDELTWNNKTQEATISLRESLNTIFVANKMIFENNPDLIKMKKSIMFRKMNEGRDIDSMVFEILDDYSILLLYGFITGNYPLEPKDEYRSYVLEYIKTHPGSKAEQMVMGTETSADAEIKETETLDENFDNITVFESKNTKYPVLIRKNKAGNVCTISENLSSNKYRVTTIK